MKTIVFLILMCFFTIFPFFSSTSVSHTLILYSFILFFLLGITHSNRIKKAEKFAHLCLQTFIRYCIQSVLAYILYICACVREKIERALRKGCSFYFLSISLILQWRSLTQISISSKHEKKKDEQEKILFFLLITLSFLIIELA